MSNRYNKKRVRKPVYRATKRRGGMNSHNEIQSHRAAVRQRVLKEKGL